MKLYALLVYDTTYKLINSFYNLNDVSIVYRWMVKQKIEQVAGELVRFVVKDCCYKINEKRGDLDVVIYGYGNDKYHILIADREYSASDAFRLLSMLMNGQNVTVVWNSQKNVFSDIKNELEETKIILLDSIEKLLDRQEKLDELLDKTNELGVRSQFFRTQAEDMNKCCVLF